MSIPYWTVRVYQGRSAFLYMEGGKILAFMSRAGAQRKVDELYDTSHDTNRFYRVVPLPEHVSNPEIRP